MANEIIMKFLGTGTIRSGPDQFGSSVLIKTLQGNILLDCGPGTLIRLKQLGFEPGDIKYIFLTHFHPDHVADLIPLIFVRVNQLSAPDRDIQIWGPPGLNRYMDGMNSAYGKWMEKPGYTCKELIESPMNFEDFRVTWLKVFHNNESIGYRFEFGQSAVAFSGDSGFCPELVMLASGTHTTVLECAFPDGSGIKTHLTPQIAGEVAKQARPGQLLLTHIYPETLKENPEAVIRTYYNGTIKLVRDLDTFKIPV
ncbi:MAG: MBL fold metallo-hydrolase [Calditrichaeota bacterium]|nr:MBL fold metallo-hydrolase [Calditrichota bacterium]RQW03243.1 MAG: MBL fold metallo-hydrolase [Calditrichota bacterium]